MPNDKPNNDSLKTLNSIEKHLSEINKTDKIIKDTERKSLELEKKTVRRKFKKDLSEKITADKGDKTDQSLVKAVNELKPDKTLGDVSKSFTSALWDWVKFTKTDNVEDLLKDNDTNLKNLKLESITSNLWLRDIFFEVSAMAAHMGAQVESVFEDDRRKEKNQEIQEERNALIADQTEVIEKMLSDDRGIKDEAGKGFFGKLKGIGGLIGNAFGAIFSFFKLGSLTAFFKGLKPLQAVVKVFKASGGILGWIAKALFGALAAAGTFILSFNLGTKISEWIDEKMGLGKGSLGVWLFDAIHSEAGLFGTLKQKIFDWLDVESWGALFIAMQDKFWDFMTDIGQKVKSLLIEFDLWNAIVEPFKVLGEFFPELWRATKELVQPITDWVIGFANSVVNLKNEIVNKFKAVGEQIGAFLSDPIDFVKTLILGEESIKVEHAKDEIEVRAQKLLREMEARENRNVAIDILKRENIKSKIKKAEIPTGNSVVISNRNNNNIITGTDLTTETSDRMFKELQLLGAN